MGVGSVIDVHGTEPGQTPGSDATSSPGAATGSPAEKQFPYVATHGLQPTASTPPAFSPRTRRRSRRRRRLTRALGAGAALFALVVTAAYLTWGPRSALGARSEIAAAQAVRGYLEALADGDAASALGYALEPPADVSLLTDQVLGELQASTPLRAIFVDAPTEPGRVPASYLLGDQQISTVFELTLRDGVWKLDQVAAPTDLSSFPIPVAVNGVVPASARPDLFPGHYQIASASARYVVREVAFDVRHPFEQQLIRGSLDLSEAGRAEVVAAAETQFADCLSRRDLHPPGCGFAVASPDETPLDESSVAWSTHGTPDFTELAVSLDHAGSASADLDITIHGDVHGVDGSRWEAHVHLTRLRADLTGPAITIQFG